MGRVVSGHYIGEPISDIPLEDGPDPIETFLPKDFVQRGYEFLMKRMIMIIVFMFSIMVLVISPFILLSGFGLGFFILFGCLILFSFVMAFCIVFFSFRRSIKKRGSPRTDIFPDHLRLFSYYTFAFPCVVASIPLKNIRSIEFRGAEIWARNLKRTPGVNKVMNGIPILPDEGLYSSWSRPEDLVEIFLRTPINVKKMAPPVGWRGVAKVRVFRLGSVIIDIDSRSHYRFEKMVLEGRDRIG